MARARDKGYPLIEAANLYTKPGMIRIGHVGSYKAACDLSPIRVAPRNALCANITAEL
jgi:hypothetical protein